jgi:hypothetical protein
MTNHGQRAAELEREVAAQRAQVESTIGELKERLTPGQLIDEMLSYTKHGGAHFASSLGSTVSANPLPAALLGVSLIWLMAGPKPQNGHAYSRDEDHRADRSYRGIAGSGLQRVSHDRDDAGLWYSEWVDDAGARYRARSDKAGNRMGHFIDEAGKSVSGFFDEAGRRVEEFRDETGSLLDQATEWANHAWDEATTGVNQQVSGLVASAARMSGDVSANAQRMTRDAMRVLEDQPLVLGALAFAAGAALGATLPHTEEEDALMGEAADEVKREAGHIAADLYEKGKERAGEVYSDVSEKAGEIYEDAKGKIAGSDGSAPSTRH